MKKTNVILRFKRIGCFLQLEEKILELKAAVEKRVTLVADMEVITHDHYEDDEN